MAWTNAHLDGSSVGSFKLQAGSIMQYVGQDHDLNSIGTAILEVSVGYKGSEAGRYFSGVHLVSGDQYYQWFMAGENRGWKGALEDKHVYHLCSCSSYECEETRATGEVIHIDQWRIVSRADAAEILAEWNHLDDSVRLLAHDNDEESLEAESAEEALPVKPKGKMKKKAGKPKKVRELTDAFRLRKRGLAGDDEGDQDHFDRSVGLLGHDNEEESLDAESGEEAEPVTPEGEMKRKAAKAMK